MTLHAVPLTSEQQANMAQHAAQIIRLLRGRAEDCRTIGHRSRHRPTVKLGELMGDVAHEAQRLLDDGQPAEVAGFHATQFALLTALDVQALYERVTSLPSQWMDDPPI